jgi:hypothetical protein
LSYGPRSANAAGAGLRALFALLILIACSAPPPPARPANLARQLVPVPICLSPLGNTPAGASTTPQPADYWPLLWPHFDPRSGQLDPLDRDCSGRQALAAWAGTTNSLRPRTAEALISKGADDLEVIWLPILLDAAPDGTGLIALGRRRERRLEVYAIGVHGGDPERTHLAWQRLGPRLLVSALEGCAAAPTATCESSVSLYLARHGRLAALGSVVLERTALGAPSSRGAEPLEYHFQTTLLYRPDGIHLQEHLAVRDRVRGEVRRSDLERILVLRKDQLVQSEPSLWQQISAELSGAPR